MKFSVIIPAYNEQDYLGKALAAVKRQDVPPTDFEVIVVDNMSTDKTFKIAQDAGCVAVQEKHRGTNSARHRGFLVSKGEILAYLDADCEPPSNWLRRIEQELQEPGVVAVSGPYDYGFDNFTKTMDRWYTESLIPHMDTVLYSVFRRKAAVMLGGNFGVWRTALEKIGGITPFKHDGEDAAIAMTLSRQAGKVVFDPTLVVKSSPRRFEKEGFLRTNVWYMFSYFLAYSMRYFPKYKEERADQ